MEHYLDYISIKGFRSIRAIEKLELRPINISIGANGSGKSNFVEVFSFLNAIRRGQLRNYTAQRGGADKILHFGSKITPEIEIEISFISEVNGYKILLCSTDIDELYIKDESCWFWDKQGYSEPDYESLKAVNGEAGISQACEGNVSWVQSSLDDWRIYHFHDTSAQSPMKRIADVNDHHFLRSDGSNLPAYLLLLREQHPSKYRLIRNTVRRVAAFFDDFQLVPLRRNANKIRLEWMHKLSDQYFDVSSLSDGTLRFICLATLLLQPAQERPSPIILDEPELGLHPYAITMLASMVKAAATETQIIISTQSPLLLDHFEPEDILVTELEDGATTLTRLQSSELKSWLEDYSLGQLWEKNQFGGRP
ncbi:MAG: AAA family ATPase [Hormoscilla sp. GUM202]|nr:AAA family ATPase [Hormoscilla sp. GUM202]MBO1348056.1 AAA family ATPase [Hormoscilla sp. GUM202]